MQPLLPWFTDPQLKFPADYPSACLLGSVDVQDVMDQDAYRKKVHTRRIISSVERQKGLITSHSHIYLDPFAFQFVITYFSLVF
jgi:hypothetical protein